VAWVSPSRWGYAATAATLNLTRVLPAAAPGTPRDVEPEAGPVCGRTGHPASTDPLCHHTVATWLTDMGVLLLLAVIFGLLAWRRLVTMRPLRRR
jgi:ABC transport system ATP-binding/permease protein